MTDSDGMDEAFHGSLRTSLMIATRIAEQLARVRQAQLQRARERSEQQGRATEHERAALERALDARRSIAVASLSPVSEASWWASATPQRIADSYETAQSWAPLSPEAAAARDRIGEQIRLRYGLDPAELGPNTPEILRATAAAANDRATAAKERAEADNEAASAQLLMSEATSLAELSHDTYKHADELERGVDWDAGDDKSIEAFTAAEEARLRAEDYQQQADSRVGEAADRYEQSGVHRDRAETADGRADRGMEYARTLQPAVPHDSPERRQELANSISGTAPEPVLQARLLADLSQATPPSAAVNTGRGKTAKASKARGGIGQERARSERAR